MRLVNRGSEAWVRPRAARVLRSFALSFAWFCVPSLASGQGSTRAPWDLPAASAPTSGQAPRESVAQSTDASGFVVGETSAHDAQSSNTPAGSSSSGGSGAATVPPSPLIVPASSGVDVVVLRDGSELRGIAIDIRTGQSITVRLSSGEVRVVGWDEIATARGPSFRASPSSSPSPSVRAPAPAPPARAAMSGDDDVDEVPLRFSAGFYLRPRPGAVPVRIESDGDPLTVGLLVTAPYASSAIGPGPTFGASLGYGTSSIGAGYGYGPSLANGYGAFAVGVQVVCSTPCTLYLAPGPHTLQLGGAGRRESTETIEVGNRPARFRFRSASRAAHGLGTTLLWIGIGSAVLGTLLLVDNYSRCSGACDPTLAIGLLIAGGLGIGTGTPLIIFNATGLSEERSPRAPRPSSARLRFGGAVMPGGGIAALGGIF